VLKWAGENGCPWNESTCSAAAFRGHLEVLKWPERMVVLGMKILVIPQSHSPALTRSNTHNITNLHVYFVMKWKEKTKIESMSNLYDP